MRIGSVCRSKGAAGQAAGWSGVGPYIEQVSGLFSCGHDTAQGCLAGVYKLATVEDGRSPRYLSLPIMDASKQAWV